MFSGSPRRVLFGRTWSLIKPTTLPATLLLRWTRTSRGSAGHPCKTLLTKIKLGHENYSPNVPASVHGAPQNEEDSREILELLNRMSAFEGQDFDKNENDVSRAAQLNRDELDYANEEAWKWILAFLVGAIMGVLMFIVDITLEGINTLKFGTVKRLIASTGGFWAPYAVLLCFNMGFAAITGYIVAFEAPFAAGSGIPELKSYLNGIHLRGFLSLRTFVCKFIGVITCIAAGLVSSKGGPFVHLGSIVGGGLSGMGSSTLSQLFGRPIKAPRRYGGYFRNDADHRDYVSIGAAAGITSSFSAPLGGLLLAVEEHSSFYTTNIFWRGFVSTCTAVTVLHVLAQLRLHPGAIFESKFGIRRDYGLYDDNKALYGKVYFYYLWELPIYAAMGVFGGCMGVLFIKLNIVVSRLRGRFVPVMKRGRRIAEVVTIAWVTSTVFFLACWVGECKPLPSARHLSFYEMDGDEQDIYAGVDSVDPSGLKHFPRLWCAPDHYNENGRLFLNPLVQALRTIYHFGETLPAGLPDSAGLTWDLLALWAMIVFPLSIFSAGMAATTGLFMPWLSVGAAWGRLTGLVITALAKRMGSSLPISLSAYTVIGASAQLSGITRNILAMSVLTMESTGSLQLIVPIMVAVFAAKMTGDALSLGFYEVQIKIRGAPTLLEPNLKAHQAMVSDKLHVHEVMTTQLLALAPVGKVKDLVDVLQRCKHQAFPVTPDVSGAWQSVTVIGFRNMALDCGIVSLSQ
ncbi:hypothetical protein WJX84_007554 [Apatococcus fuscideae]|uniref:Chloride channel protein n=1 Tax=Apatococcus fuscideae TaxID=2026836 RepID=A0AAW1SQ16_9CHLO